MQTWPGLDGYARRYLQGIRSPEICSDSFLLSEICVVKDPSNAKLTLRRGL
jgi:hypothetical protein